MKLICWTLKTLHLVATAAYWIAVIGIAVIYSFGKFP